MKSARIFGVFLGLLGVALVCAALWLARGNHPGVVVYPSLAMPNQARVAGRVVFEVANQTDSGSPLLRNLKRLLAPSWSGTTAEINFHGQSASAVSSAEGAFEAEFQALGPSAQTGFPAGLTTASVSIAKGVTAQGEVQVLSPQTPFLVISDFDDTIAVTQVVDKAKLVESALLKEGESQPLVEGMNAWYQCMATAHGSAPAFALVSGSPVQYLDRVQAFLSKHRFPFMGVYLRTLKPQTLSNYKQPVIRRLMESFPFPVVLIGDSGEHDPEVYAEIRAEYTTRVKGIFIRDAGRSTDQRRFEGMTLFHTVEEAKSKAQAMGLLTSNCRPVSGRVGDAANVTGNDTVNHRETQ